MAGQALGGLSNEAWCAFRALSIGFVFQHFNLLPVLTAAENVEYPLLLTAWRRPSGRGVCTHCARPWAWGIGRGVFRRSSSVASAIVLADEPTANLDSHNGAAIFALMRQLQREFAVSFVFSSHDPQVLAAVDDALRNPGRPFGLTVSRVE